MATFPELQGTATTGKTKMWSIRVFDRASCCASTTGLVGVIETTHGYVDGKKQVNEKIISEGKNIGKKNETSPLQQCIAETKKKWQDKIDKESYTLDQFGEIQKENPKVFPMLAHIYHPDNAKIKKNNIELFNNNGR